MSRKESRAARRKRIVRNRIIAVCAAAVLIIVLIIVIASCGGKKENGSNGSGKSDETSTIETKSGDESSGSDESKAETKAETKESGSDGDTESESSKEESESESSEAETDTESQEAVSNEKPVYLYMIDYTDNTCTRTDKFTSAWSVDEDLVTFGAFASDEDSFSFTSEVQAHNETWNSVETEKDYKIGYEISFDVDGEHKVITILKPGDIEDCSDLYNGDYPDDGDYSGITGYMGVWVYDDLNQEDGSFYTHITQSEVTDETVLTSIKLRPTPDSDQISNLVLKAFSYSSQDEFDSDGHYIGDYASQVSIVND